MPKSITSQTN